MVYGLFAMNRALRERGERRNVRGEGRRRRMEDGGWRMEDGGCRMQDAGCRMQDRGGSEGPRGILTNSATCSWQTGDAARWRERTRRKGTGPYMARDDGDLSRFTGWLTQAQRRYKRRRVHLCMSRNGPVPFCPVDFGHPRFRLSLGDASEQQLAKKGFCRRVGLHGFPIQERQFGAHDVGSPQSW